MFKIESFLLRPGKVIYDLADAIANYQQYFVSIDDNTEMRKIINYLDRNYVEGAITINYYEKIIIDFSLWDVIDQLWSCIVNTVKLVVLNGEAMTFFPDQPIKIIIRDLKKINSILFKIQFNNKIVSHVLPKKEFFEEILTAAQHFFQTMLNYNKRSQQFYTSELRNIESTKKLLERFYLCNKVHKGGTE